MSQQPYILKLYITGSSPRSERAIANLVHLCEQELADNYELSIIDVLEQPQLQLRLQLHILASQLHTIAIPCISNNWSQPWLAQMNIQPQNIPSPPQNMKF